MFTKDLKYYQRLPYTRRSELKVEDGERYWLAWVEELPGCKTDGTSQADAMLNLATAFDDYIEAMLAWKTAIPEPARVPAAGIPEAKAVRISPVKVRSAGQDVPGAPQTAAGTAIQASEPTGKKMSTVSTAEPIELEPVAA